MPGDLVLLDRLPNVTLKTRNDSRTSHTPTSKGKQKYSILFWPQHFGGKKTLRVSSFFFFFFFFFVV